MRRTHCHPSVWLMTLATALLFAVPAMAQPSFIAFDSGPVRPIAEKAAREDRAQTTIST